ncbi:MAG: hypothetical protein KBC72_00575 [Acinetobacter sp.]|nr:hypothetical protein [Acinetobacter sp.]
MASFKDILKGAGKGALQGLASGPLGGMGLGGGVIGGVAQGLMDKFFKKDQDDDDQPETMVSRPFKSTLVKNSNPRSPYKMEY